MHVITNVESTTACVPDVVITETIHQSLAKKKLVPAQHLVDCGYVDAKLLLHSTEQYGLELIGPVRAESGWQALAQNGFAASDFKIEWEAKRVSCPMGKACTQP